MVFQFSFLFIFFFLLAGIEINRTSQAFLVKESFGFYYSSFLSSSRVYILFHFVFLVYAK